MLTMTKRLLFLMVFTLTTPLFAGYTLQVQQTTANDGAPVEVGVDLVSTDQPISALVFTIEYDASRLRFDAQSKTAGALQNIQIDTPAAFDTSAYYLADSKQIGVSVYDASLPLAALRPGRIATFRFDTVPSSSGFGYVRFSATNPPSAASDDGREVTGSSLVNGGVTVASRRGQLGVSPSALDFGTVRFGQPATRSIIVSNDGTAPLHVSAVALNGDAIFQMNGDRMPTTIDAGGSRRFDVTVTAPTAGTYSAQLAVDGENGQRITVPISATALSDGNYSYDNRWIVPALVRANGSNNSTWRTALVLANGGANAINVRLTAHTSTGEVHSPKLLDIAPGTTTRIADVVSANVGDGEFRGYLLIESSAPDLVSRVEIVNESTDGTSRTESVPVLSPSQAFHTGESALIAGVTQAGAARTNLGILNTSNHACAFRVALRSAGGVSRGDRVSIAAPNELLEPLDVLSALNVTDEVDASVTFTAETPDCSFYPFAATVDASGNLTFLYPR